MSNAHSLNRNRARRWKIIATAMIPLVAATIIATLESGRWLVVYNDTEFPLAEVELRSSTQRWVVSDLAPKTSRRMRVSDDDTARLTVHIPEWEEHADATTLVNQRDCAILTVRLKPSREIVSTGEASLWTKWLSW